MPICLKYFASMAISANINFVKPQINIDFNTLDISSYPTYDKLYEKIASNYGVQSDEIELFNGGSSTIFSLFKLASN
jgi:threonine-phosphate decarboxylase